MKKLLYNTMKKLLLIICFLIISFQAWGAMTDIPILIPGLSGGGYSNTQLNGANEQVGHIAYFATTTGAAAHIEKVVWSTNAVTTGDSIDVRIESVDPATGCPTGTLISTGSNGTQVVADSDDYTTFETELGTHWDMTSGQWLAIVFKMPNSSKDLTISTAGTFYLATGNGAYVCEDITGAGWAKSFYKTNIALKTSTGAYLLPYGGMVGIMQASTNINSSPTNPQYIGNKIVSPVSLRLSGFYITSHDMDTNFTVQLWDASGNVLKGDDASTNMSVAIDSEYRSSTTEYQHSPIRFPCTKTLTASTAYYLVIVPGADNVNVRAQTFGSETLKELSLNLPSSWEMTYVSSPNTISFTEVTYRYCSSVLPVFDQIDTGSTNGGGAWGF